MKAKWMLTIVLAVAASLAGCNGDAQVASTDAGDPQAMSAADAGPFAKPGFVTELVDGRLWVFHAGSDALADFRAKGEPAKLATRPGAGPQGLTVKGEDLETINEYLCTRDGFAVDIVDGRLWVFRRPSKDWDAYQAAGEPAKHITRIGAGPMGMTIKAPDGETITEYLTWKPGFDTRYHDERLWVFRAASAALADFDAGGEPAKSVSMVAAGPYGLTVRAVERDIAVDYLVAHEDFDTVVSDGRIWVFRLGSDAWADWKVNGEPAKSVTRVSAGPLGMSVRAPDAATIDAYLSAVGR